MYEKNCKTYWTCCETNSYFPQRRKQKNCSSAAPTKIKSLNVYIFLLKYSTGKTARSFYLQQTRMLFSEQFRTNSFTVKSKNSPAATRRASSESPAGKSTSTASRFESPNYMIKKAASTSATYSRNRSAGPPEDGAAPRYDRTYVRCGQGGMRGFAAAGPLNQLTVVESTAKMQEPDEDATCKRLSGSTAITWLPVVQNPLDTKENITSNTRSTRLNKMLSERLRKTPANQIQSKTQPEPVQHLNKTNTCQKQSAGEALPKTSLSKSKGSPGPPPKCSTKPVFFFHSTKKR